MAGLPALSGADQETVSEVGAAGYRHHHHIADGGRGLGEGRSGEHGQREHAAEGGPRQSWEIRYRVGE